MRSWIGRKSDVTKITMDLHKMKFSFANHFFLFLLKHTWQISILLILVDMQTDKPIAKQIVPIFAKNLFSTDVK